MGILDFIFPKRCVGCKIFGSYLCADCFSKISFDVEYICLVCNRRSIDGVTHPSCRTKLTIDGALASVVYKGMIKRLISAFKYKPYLSDLQTVLTDFFYEGLIQQELFIKLLQTESIFVPIPLHPAKLRQRSYNQAEILARDLGKRLNIPVKNLLKRIKKTDTQTVLTREKRLENIKGAFEIKSTTGITSTMSITGIKQIILIDDVITSGATMLEAANILKRAGVGKVWGIALAHGK